jgi:sec-independent protein translocase protein TatA
MFRNPTTDLIVVLVIVLLIFGPKRLPALGRQLGSGLREFKDSITGDSKHSEEDEHPPLESGPRADTPGSVASAPPSSATPSGPSAPSEKPTGAATQQEQRSAEVGSEPRP